jgi:hypothetical protein
MTQGGRTARKKESRMTTYISPADTAKMLRAKLAKSFPGVKFYVRTSVYAGGASIDVYYDGLDHYAPPITCTDHPGVNRPGDWCATDGTVFNWTPVYKPGMPTKDAVNVVARAYAGESFDGMIDMAFGIYATIDANGDVVATASTGTADSRGSVPAWGDTAAATVKFGADYVFVNDELPYNVRVKKAKAA